MAEFDCFPCVSRSGIQVWTMNDVQRVALAGYEVDVEENSRNCANGAAGGDFVYCMQSSVWNQHNIQNELVPLFVFEEMKDSSVVQYYGQKILVLVKVSHRPRIRIRHNCLSNQSLSYPHLLFSHFQSPLRNRRSQFSSDAQGRERERPIMDDGERGKGWMEWRRGKRLPQERESCCSKVSLLPHFMQAVPWCSQRWVWEWRGWVENDTLKLFLGWLFLKFNTY